MSTAVAGALAVTPAYVTSADAIVSWDDAGATWRSLGTIPVGGGTVTSIAGGTGITVSPSPIVGSGTVSLTVPVSVANGGTGASTAFTPGSVIFAGAGGAYSQDNPNLFWDDGNNRMGIGTASPKAQLSVGSTGDLLNLYYAGNNVLGIQTTLDDQPLGTYGGTTGRLQLQPLAGTLTLVEGGGNVGIGTAAPGQKLDVTGNIAASGAYYVGSAPLLSLASGYTTIYEPAGGAAIQLGPAVDPTNYYNNTSHVFRDRATSVQYGRWNATGLGIGIAPLNKFQVNLATNLNVCVSYVNSVAQILGINDTNSAYHALYIDAVDLALCNKSGGNVIVGTGGAVAKLTAYGTTANSSGAWLVISGRELKQDIVPYTRGLAAITALNPVMFRYRADTPFARSADDPGEPLIGLIADEVEPYVPEIVGETTATVGKDERSITTATLEPGNLIYCVINALKTIAERLDKVEAALGVT